MHVTVRQKLQFILCIALTATVFTSGTVLLAWTGPTQNPTDGNVAAPINVGSIDQIKSAGLGIDALAVFGNAYIENNIGIGTMNPTHRLHVVGTIRADNGFCIDTNCITRWPQGSTTGVTVGQGLYNSGTAENVILNFGPVSTWIASEDGVPRLHFGNGSHTYLRTGGNFYFRDTENATRMTLTGAGNLGIGTIAPVDPIHLSGSDKDVQFRIENLSSSARRWPGINIRNFAGSSAGHPTVHMFQANGSSASPSAVQEAQTLGTVAGWGYYGSGYNQSARIDLRADANWTSSSIPGRITFSTTPPNVSPGTNTWEERMRIDSNGNVGIGGPSKGARLEVSGTTKLGAGGVAFSAMGGCYIGTFVATLGANFQTCSGIPANAAVSCSPSRSLGATRTWSTRAPSANTVVIHMSADAINSASWRCMWMMP